MQPNKKRTKSFKPGRVQQRLIDYSIFTGESLALINKHFVLQANGQRPFTQEELHAIDHGIKKNRKRAIESYTKGSTRSEYRPTLKLGYYPEEEDIELRDPDISTRQLLSFSAEHYKEQKMGKSKKSKSPKPSRVKVSTTSMKALPHDVVHPQADKNPIAAFTQNIDVQGQFCHLLYDDIQLDDNSRWLSGYPVDAVAMFNENSHKKKINGREHRFSSLLLSLKLMTAEGYGSNLVSRPFVSEDGSVVYVQINTGSKKTTSLLAAILAQLRLRSNTVPAHNLETCREEFKDRSLEYITVGFRFADGFKFDPNLLADCEIKGTNEVAPQHAIGKYKVKKGILLGKSSEDCLGLYLEIGIKGSVEASKRRTLTVQTSDVARALEQLNIEASNSDEDSDSSSSDDSSRIHRSHKKKSSSPLAKAWYWGKKKLSPKSKSSSEWSEWDREAAKAKAYRRLRERLEEDGKRIVPIEGDGNCAPTALAYSEEGLTSRQLRELVTKHMLENALYFFDFYSVSSMAEYKKQVEELAKPGVWFDEAAVLATAQCLGRDVLVHSPHYEDPQRHPCGWPKPRGKPIEVAFNGANHYETVVSRNNHNMEVDSEEEREVEREEFYSPNASREEEESPDDRGGSFPAKNTERTGQVQVSPLSSATGLSTDNSPLHASPSKRKRNEITRRKTRSQTVDGHEFQHLGDNGSTVSSFSSSRKQQTKKVKN